MLSEPRPEYQGIVLHETFGTSHSRSRAAC